MFCPSCGKQTPDAAQFCSNCGAYLAPPPPAAVSPSSPPGTMPVTAPPIATPAGAAVSTTPLYAGFWMRLVAHIIDGILLNVIAFILFLPLAVMLGIASAGAGRMAEDLIGGMAVLIWIPLSIGTSWFYEAGFTSSTRQATPGKMVLSLVVTDERGARISFGRATGRYFGKILSGFILWIGYLIQPFTEKRQALHDMLAGTLVVRRLPGP